MIGYTTVGTNNHEKASAFYDELFAVLGAKRTMAFDKFIMWGTAADKPMFALTPPHDGKPASVGNGVMIALSAGSKEKVEEVYKKALELGGTCEGEPGERGGDSFSFYAAYFRDLDGNKLNAFIMGPK